MEREKLLDYLNDLGINAIFHYLSLHKSNFYTPRYNGNDLPECDRYSTCLIRLPLYFELTDHEVDYISNKIVMFYGSKN